MYAIGNNELERLPEVGDTITCHKCGQEHPVEYGEKVLTDGTREPSKTIGFYRCGKKTFLASIDGRNVVGLR